MCKLKKNGNRFTLCEFLAKFLLQNKSTNIQILRVWIYMVLKKENSFSKNIYPFLVLFWIHSNPLIWNSEWIRWVSRKFLLVNQGLIHHFSHLLGVFSIMNINNEILSSDRTILIPLAEKREIETTFSDKSEIFRTK